jgi:hypothetical protein
VSTVEPNQSVDRTSISQWLLPAFWILVGSGFYFGATQITTAVVQDKHDPGPSAICMLCAVVLVVLGVTQTVKLAIAGLRTTATNPSSNSDASQKNTNRADAILAASQSILGVCAIAFYIFAVFQIGFGLATLVFGIISMKSLGASWLGTLLATATCIATVYLVFIELLGILLPTGRWDLPF